jgi:hypothetical protein
MTFLRKDDAVIRFSNIFLLIFPNKKKWKKLLTQILVVPRRIIFAKECPAYFCSLATSSFHSLQKKAERSFDTDFIRTEMDSFFKKNSFQHGLLLSR